MSKNLKGCFSHESDHWRTPSHMYNYFIRSCGYFDPCPYHCTLFNGLEIDWPDKTFVNPPYSEIDKWVDKAIVEHKKNHNHHILFLLPVRTDTQWFKKLMSITNTIKFFEGRLHFNDSDKPAPFPSMLVYIYRERGPKSIRCWQIPRSYFLDKEF